MATFRVKKYTVTAPAPGAILPRWSYAATVQNVADPLDLKEITFISDDENPVSAVDWCNTVKDLIGIGDELDYACE